MKSFISSTRWTTGRAAALLASMLLVSGCAGSTSGESGPAQAQTGAPESQTGSQTPQAAAPEQAGTKAPGLLTEGTPAPDFTAQAHDGTTIRMSELRGKPVVLYFYPKDDTPGCTVEAQGFRDGMPRFDEHEAMVIGVSLDSMESHQKFAENHDLTFPLLPDTEGSIAALYGVSTEGGYARRVTFIIDRDGSIAKVFPNVNVQGHAEEVLASVQSLSTK